MKEFETCDLGERVVLVLSRRHRIKCWIIQRHFVISNISAGNITLCHGNILPASYGWIGPAVNRSSDCYCLTL